MLVEGQGIVVAVRAHGEHGAIVRALTADRGLVPGYVRGGRSTRLRPVLQPGNVVRGAWRARTEAQLPAMTVELEHSRAALQAQPLAAAALEWGCALIAAALPEGQPYPAIHAGFAGLLGALEAAPSAAGWVAALVRFELLVARELGYGGDMEVPPAADAGLPALIAAMAAHRDHLARHVVPDRRAGALDARERLVTRLARMVA